MIREAIQKLALKEDLSRQEAFETMNEIMSGNASEAQIASFLMGLRLKGETIPEIAGCAQAMRARAIPIRSKHPNLIDTCGTGGDSSGTFNISTCAAIIASAAGAVVAKHGNRAVSSRSGSADVLRALGINLEISHERVASILDEIRITFLFAPQLHGAMKFAAPVRRDMGIRTVFNILGPLTNPAGARRQLIGVFNSTLTEVLAGVLNELGSEYALVVHGQGGLDELSNLGWTKVSQLRNGEVSTYEVRADSFGFQLSNAEELQGGDPEQNAQMITQILKGVKGGAADVSVLNAGAALMVAGIAGDLKQGIEQARDAISSGAAVKKLNHWKEASHS
ncbi:MAG: anthranilate phosphoribosyltransferase [Ignavibacteriales bacterium]|nr:anthranilate phosphoribosyltransferase [Ignavibacteriales bacterium]